MTILEPYSPEPVHLPALGVWQDTIEDGRLLTCVSGAFPNVPDFTCDAWCYEGSVEFTAARRLSDGVIEMRHHLPGNPETALVTTVTPESGAYDGRKRCARRGTTACTSIPPGCRKTRRRAKKRGG
jgi:hypothetical protein